MGYNKVTVAADSLELAFASFAGFAKDSFKPSEYEGVTKVTDDGEIVYRTQLKALRLPSFTEAWDVKSVSVLTPVEIKSMTHYVPTGKAIISHYTGHDGKPAVGIVVESLVEFKAGKGE